MQNINFHIIIMEILTLMLQPLSLCFKPGSGFCHIQAQKSSKMFALVIRVEPQLEAYFVHRDKTLSDILDKYSRFVLLELQILFA